MLYEKLKNSLSILFTCLLMISLSQAPLFAQADGDAEEDFKVVVTESGIEYEIAAWDVRTIYDPTSYSWVQWETPIFETVKTKKVYHVPMSDFDQPPVFTQSCLDAENPVACTNEELQQFMKDQDFTYPVVAQNNRQEGLEYVTFVLTEKGEFEGRPTVLSKEKPCVGCADKAVEIVKKTENLWQPAVLDGKKVKVKLTIPVRFDLVGLAPK